MTVPAGWTPYGDETFTGHIGSVYRQNCGGLDEFAVLVQPHHLNLSGNMHGGVMMSMFDRTMGESVRKASQGRRFATASMTVEFKRPVRIGDFIHFAAALLKQGHKAIFMRGDAFVGQRLVGGATGLFMAVG